MKKKANDNEVFTSEELERLNGILKENEKIDFPEKLSAESMEKLLANTEASFEKEKEAKSKKQTPRNKKRAVRIIAAAAVLVFVFTSVITLTPWDTSGKNPPVVNNESKGEGSSEKDEAKYAEIEELFAGYSEKYRKYHNSFFYNINNIFSGAKAEDAAGNLMAKDDIASESATARGDYGKTNEQVSGVSEADILKNDGEYLYAALPLNANFEALYSESETKYISGENAEKEFTYTCAVSIIKEKANGKLAEAGRANIEFAENSNVLYAELLEMYVSGDRLYALAGVYEKNESEEDDTAINGAYRDLCCTVSTSNRTVLVCFDISDKGNPKELWRTEQAGRYVSSRMTDGKIIVVTDKYVDITASKEKVVEDCIPEATDQNGNYGKIDADSIYYTEKIRDSRYAVVSVTDVKEGAGSMQVKAVLGGGENVYCSGDTLYVTSSIYNSEDLSVDTVNEIFAVSADDCTETEIIKFSLKDGFEYSGKTTVKGTALNQFSIDEYDGYLRIATTTGSWGDSLENYVTVLDGELNKVGFLDGIAKGETIKSVRFSRSTAYVVTFEQTDPLFVIDLKDPASPKIVGELKIPGFSSYLHPISDTLLLGIGVDGDENGQGNGIKLSLFDVSDPTSPKEVSKYEINGLDENGEDGSYRYSCIYSTAFYSHKALCFDYENGIVYVPFAKDESYYNPQTDESTWKNTGGVYAFKIDEKEKSVTLVNEYTDSEITNAYSMRVTYTGDYVYAYDKGEGSVYSFDKSESGAVSKLELIKD